MNLFFFTTGLFETFDGRGLQWALRAHHGRTLTGPLTVGLYDNFYGRGLQWARRAHNGRTLKGPCPLNGRSLRDLYGLEEAMTVGGFAPLTPLNDLAIIRPESQSETAFRQTIQNIHRNILIGLIQQIY